MRRPRLMALLGACTAVAGGAWYVLAQRGTAPDIRFGGVPLALDVTALGVAAVLGTLLAALRHRRADDEIYEEDEPDEVTLWPVGSWPTIIVRNHGRARRPATARIVTAAPAWAPPEPDEPKALMTSNVHQLTGR
jgi:hypothetical protein